MGEPRAFDRLNFEPFLRYLAMPSEVFLYTAVRTHVNLFSSNARTVLYTPWQCGCFYATSVHLPYVTIPLFDATGMRETAGGHQPAAAKPHLYPVSNINVLIYRRSVFRYALRGTWG